MPDGQKQDGTKGVLSCNITGGSLVWPLRFIHFFNELLKYMGAGQKAKSSNLLYCVSPLKQCLVATCF